MRESVKKIKADFFSKKFRFFDMRDSKNSHKAEENEIFFCVKRRKLPKNGKYYEYSYEYGYFHKTPQMEKFIQNNFFTGCSGIQFIQWENCWNVVFDEATILGGISFRMENEEFNKLFV